MSTGNAETGSTSPQTFPCPQGLLVVITASVQSRCPFTGAPDSYVLRLEYVSTGRCVEAISLGEWLDGFKGKTISQEELADAVASTMAELLEPDMVCASLRGTHGSVEMTVEKCYEKGEQ